MSPRRQLGGGTTDDVDLTRPVERQVEARSADDVSGSIVRTLYFADTFLMNGLCTACLPFHSQIKYYEDKKNINSCIFVKF